MINSILGTEMTLTESMLMNGNAALHSSIYDDILSASMQMSNLPVKTLDILIGLSVNKLLSSPYLEPNGNQSSTLSSRDCVDALEENPFVKDSIDASDSSQFHAPQSVAKDSTSSLDINQANEMYERMLRRRTPAFVWQLRHTDFEDGISNAPTEEVKTYLKGNLFVTITWLHSLYSYYQCDNDVLAALLRVTAMAVDADMADKLITMIIAGLNAPSSKTQEAAIMVIEEWRTRECLQALENSTFNSSWIGDYAETVKNELIEELG